MFVMCGVIANKGTWSMKAYVKNCQFQDNVYRNLTVRFVFVSLVDVTARKSFKAFSVTETIEDKRKPV